MSSNKIRDRYMELIAKQGDCQLEYAIRRQKFTAVCDKELAILAELDESVEDIDNRNPGYESHQLLPLPQIHHEREQAGTALQDAAQEVYDIENAIRGLVYAWPELRDD